MPTNRATAPIPAMTGSITLFAATVGFVAGLWSAPVLAQPGAPTPVPPVPDAAAVSPTCPLSDQELALTRDIAMGRVVPQTASASAHGRISLTVAEMNQWSAATRQLDALSIPGVRKRPDGTPVRVFVAVFDGTWNDKDDARIPITVPGQLANDLVHLGAADEGVVTRYYEGVGTRVNVFLKRLYGATGWGTVERAERALADYRAATAANGGLPPYVYAIGFSRGAASARHFLNLVDALDPARAQAADAPFADEMAWAFAPGRIRSSALLFDTVATGQEDRLQLGLPASNELAVHLIATREFRLAFPYVPLAVDAGRQVAPDADPQGRALELLVPGAHADIGGGYDEGIWRLALALARDLLGRQGLVIGTGEPARAEQAILNLGRHNSDWVTSPVAGQVQEALFGAGRGVVDTGATSRPMPGLAQKMERGMRSARAALERLERVQARQAGATPAAAPLSFQLTPSSEGYALASNCASRAFGFDAAARWITLDGAPFVPVARSGWASLTQGVGIIVVYEAPHAADWQPAAVLVNPSAHPK